MIWQISCFPPTSPQGMRLYPNPSEGTVTLALTDWNGQPYDVSVMNLQGQEVRSVVGIGQDRVQMERGVLPQGIYLVTLRQSGEILGSVKLVWLR